MRKHLKTILMIFGMICLTNMILAQAYVTESAADDFFEFVVVEETDTPNETEEVADFETVETESEVDEIAGTVEAEPVNEVAVTEESEAVVEPTISAVVLETSVSEAVAATPDDVTPTVARATENSALVAATPEENSVSAILYEQDEPDYDEEEVVEEEPVDEKAPSRSVTIKKKQYLDVTYPGEGWLYMGDENSSKALSFKGREQKGNTTVMKFYSDRAGEALLHFCKQDILTDTYIHDYLLVVVEKLSGNKQHIQAPEYVPAPVVSKETEEEEINTEEQKYEPESQESIETTEITEVTEQSEPEEAEPENEDIIIGGSSSLSDEPDVMFSFGDGIDFSDGGDDDYYQTLIDEANDAFFAGRGQEAVEKAQIVIDDGSYFSDEALYIQAQVYETDTALLDVNKAYSLYKTIVDYYPESSYWSKASKRVTYLDRYYFQIR